MPRENARQKADRLVAEGRVTVLRITAPEHWSAVVTGDHDPYLVERQPGTAWCECPGRAGCSHYLAAVEVVARQVKGEAA